MCFTVNVNLVKEELENRYGAGFIDHENFRPSYYYHAHSFPKLPTVTHGPDGKEIKLLQWGLVPDWIDSREGADKIRSLTLNARSETSFEKPAFAESIRNRRCLVPVSGFYEWQHLEFGKRPWYIYWPDQPVFSLAGIYDSWTDPETGDEKHTFSILTCQSNTLLSKIHNSKKRMPVILCKGDEDMWLDKSGSYDRIIELMQTFKDNTLNAHEISPLIGRRDAEKNTPDLIEPYDYPVQGSLF